MTLAQPTPSCFPTGTHTKTCCLPKKHVSSLFLAASLAMVLVVMLLVVGLCDDSASSWLVGFACLEVLVPEFVGAGGGGGELFLCKLFLVLLRFMFVGRCVSTIVWLYPWCLAEPGGGMFIDSG